MTRDLSLGVVDVIAFLEGLDVQNVRRELSEARFSCPYPAHSFGDKNPSAYMNLETTAFICFSCGAAGNAITFLSDIKGVSRLTAKNWIAQKWAPHYADIDDLRAFVERMFAQAQEQSEEECVFMPLMEFEYEKRIVDWEESAALMQPDSDGAVPYMLRRGFDPLFLNMFDVCYDEIADRTCVTVRERDGSLVGFKGRAWREDQWPKYLVLGDTDRSLAERGEVFGFRPYDASRHVFGINHVDDGVGIIVCEGELNVIAMYQKGFANVVGPSGSTVSLKQVEDICNLTDEVTLLFDTDPLTPESYATAKMKLMKAIDSFEPFAKVRVCGDHSGDPADMSAGDLRSLVESAKSSTRYRVLHKLGESV